MEKIIKDKPVWADASDAKKIKNWNALDGNIDRRSHMGEYEIIEGVPRNPVGRTGISGRGQLGKWGVNHAADPVVTRLLDFIDRLHKMREREKSL